MCLTQPSSSRSRSMHSRTTTSPRAAFSTRPSRSMMSRVVERGPARDGMPRVGADVRQRRVGERRGDLARDDRGPERRVAARDALRDRQDVGRRAPVVEAEHAARPAEPGDHLVDDQEDAVAGADVAQRREVAVVGHLDRLPERDRLGDHGGHGVGPLAQDRALDVAGALERASAVDGAEAAAPGRRLGHVDEPRHERRERLARLGDAGRRHRAVRRAVVGAVAADDLHPVWPALTAVIGPNDLERRLVRLAARWSRRGRADRRPGRAGSAARRAPRRRGARGRGRGMPTRATRPARPSRPRSPRGRGRRSRRRGARRRRGAGARDRRRRMRPRRAPARAGSCPGRGGRARGSARSSAAHAPAAPPGHGPASARRPQTSPTAVSSRVDPAPTTCRRDPASGSQRG